MNPVARALAPFSPVRVRITPLTYTFNVCAKENNPRGALHYGNEIMPMAQVCVRTARRRLIERAQFPDYHNVRKTWHTQTRTQPSQSAISSLWSRWLLYELPVNGILLLSLRSMHRADLNPSDRAATCSTGTHSLFRPAVDRKKQGSRAREETNKQREIQSRGLIHSVTNAPRSLRVPFSLTSPIYLAPSFLSFFPPAFALPPSSHCSSSFVWRTASVHAMAALTRFRRT